MGSGVFGAVWSTAELICVKYGCHTPTIGFSKNLSTNFVSIQYSCLLRSMHFQQFCRVHYFRIDWFGTLQDKTASSVDVQCSSVVCLRVSIWLILSEPFDCSYCFSSVTLNETSQALPKSVDSGFARCVNAFTTSQMIDWLKNHIYNI